VPEIRSFCRRPRRARQLSHTRLCLCRSWSAEGVSWDAVNGREDDKRGWAEWFLKTTARPNWTSMLQLADGICPAAVRATGDGLGTERPSPVAGGHICVVGGWATAGQDSSRPHNPRLSFSVVETSASRKHGGGRAEPGSLSPLQAVASTLQPGARAS